MFSDLNATSQNYVNLLLSSTLFLFLPTHDLRVSFSFPTTAHTIDLLTTIGHRYTITTMAEEDTEAQPTTAIVVLGEAMFFKPQAHVISITLFQREQFRDALDQMAVHDSLDTMHVVVKTSELDALYDPEAIKEFYPCLKVGAELAVHVIVGENETPGEEDGSIVRTSLVLAGLRVQDESMGADGSRILTAIKPGEVGDDDEDEEDSSGDEDNS